jgi:pyruvate dehydrogenase E2 component (dihydrolipoamide acetyltransferase)
MDWVHPSLLKEILMPRFDPEMKSGRVVEWLKKEGDRVTKGEPVVRIETEKVAIDVEAPESGILSKILVQPANEVPIGTAIGSMISEDENQRNRQNRAASVEGSSVEAKALGSTQTTTYAQVRGRKTEQQQEEEFARPDWVRASPAARKAGRELNVDLKAVKGTGPMGRVTREDVERYSSSTAQRAKLAEVSKEKIPIEEFGPSPPPAAEGFKVRQLDSIRRTIAQKMSRSWTQIPQVPLFADVDLTESEKFRTAMEKLIGKRVSFTAIVTKALASSLRTFPDLNARFENDEVQEYEDVDVSVAVALESGLVTPVVKQSNRKTATDLSKEIEELAEKARAGKLTLADVRGGTVTVSNLGGFGVDYFVPIINPPQVIILGVGKSRLSPQGTPYCTITVVFDHRVTDGARAAQLLQKIKDYVENPYLLQMN